MKFLAITGFLVLFIVNGWITQKTYALVYKTLATEGKEIALRFVLIPILPLFIFVQYWLLTGLFPLTFILLILGLALLSVLAQFFLEAVLGLSTRTTKRKILIFSSFLNYQRMAQHTVAGCLSIIFIVLLGLGITVAAVWVYIVYPIGDAEAVVLLALILFAVPAVSRLFAELLFVWPVIISPFTDDDIRTGHLVNSFAWMGQRIILLIFPFWLFETHTQKLFGELPPFWLLLTIPIMALVFFAVFPFFVGLHRRRVELDEMLNWRTLWIDRMLEAVSLPLGEQRTTAAKLQLTEIDQEVQECLKKYKVFRLFQPGDERGGETPLLLEDHGLPLDEQELGEPEDLLIQDELIKEKISSAQEVLKGRHFKLNLPLGMQQEQLYKTITDNKSQLIKWDIRFSHVSEMLKLYNNSLQADKQDITQHLRQTKKNISKEGTNAGRKKKVIGGAIISVLSIGVGWLIKLFNVQILSLIRGLVDLTGK